MSKAKILLILFNDSKSNSFEYNLSSIIGFASCFNEQIDILLLGEFSDLELDKISKIAGISLIMCFENKNLFLENNNKYKLLIDHIVQYTHIIAPDNSIADLFLPFLANQINAPFINKVVDFVAPNLYKRITYSGGVLTTIEVLSYPIILSIDLMTYKHNYQLAFAEKKEILFISDNSLNYVMSMLQINFLKNNNHFNHDIIVAGGVALKSKSNFSAYILEFAKLLHAGVGATRAAIHAGYADSNLQIGQSGKTLETRLYIAIGISGAIQHMVGLKNIKTIIAINSDANAPIFSYADYGIVGDLFVIVPELIKQLKNDLN